LCASAQPGQWSRGRASQHHLAVKPPRPPLRYCRSPPPQNAVDLDYDNVPPAFAFPLTSLRAAAADRDRWIPSGHPGTADGSPSFRRSAPPARRQRSAGTWSSTGLYRQHPGPRWRVSSVPADEAAPLQAGDLSVCIGLTVQCSPMAATAVRTSAPSYLINTEPRVDPADYDDVPGTVGPWRAPPLVPVRSYDDDVPPNRWRTRCPEDVRPASSKFRSHPIQSRPQQRGQPEQRDSRVPRSSATRRPTHGYLPEPCGADWKRQQRRRFDDDFAVGFDHDATECFADRPAGCGVQDDADEAAAFDEIARQIAGLTQTVSELRSRHQRTASTAAHHSRF